MDFEELSKKFDGVITHLKSELGKIRTGRPNAALVEDIEVEAYSVTQSLKSVANISVVDSSLMTIQPWDKNLVDAVIEGIRKSSLGIQPVKSGDIVRLPIPPLTQERREEYVKLMGKTVENSKVTVRMIRKDFIDSVSKQKSSGDIGEDEAGRKEKEIQKLVDSINEKIDALAAEKEKDLLEV